METSSKCRKGSQSRIYCTTLVVSDLPHGGVTQEEGWHFKYGKKTRCASSLPTHARRDLGSSLLLRAPRSEQLHHDMRSAASAFSLISRVGEVIPER